MTITQRIQSVTTDKQEQAALLVAIALKLGLTYEDLDFAMDRDYDRKRGFVS